MNSAKNERMQVKSARGLLHKGEINKYSQNSKG